MAAFAMVPQTFAEYNRFLDNAVVDDAIERGRVVAEYQDSVMKRSAKKAVRKKFMGYQVNVINSTMWLSEMGNELAQDSCDFSLLWFYNHSERIHEISLRTIHDNIDLVSFFLVMLFGLIDCFFSLFSQQLLLVLEEVVIPKPLASAGTKTSRVYWQ
jgi:hypothetical protein